MHRISRPCLEAASGGMLDFGVSMGRGGLAFFVDLGPVFNLPFVGSLRFGHNKRIVHRVI